jgi:hypothetical protein
VFARSALECRTQRDFESYTLRTSTITCPEGQLEPFEQGSTVEFEPEACRACAERNKCTTAASGRDRTVSIAENEALQKNFVASSSQSRPTGAS